MAKYIIDIPDEHEIDWVNKSSRLGFELCFPINETATNKKYYIPTGLKLEPYTEPDRKDIENEVWEFAGHLINVSPSVTEDIYWSMNGGKGIGVAVEMTYQEAKARYDSWKQSKEEIHVGCEVHHRNVPELIIYVTDMDDNSFGGFALCRVKDVCDYGDRFSECNVHQYKPTGRVFPNIVELLKKMEEE